MPSIGPIDAALTLSVGARRAVQRRRRHLLPGAPLGALARRRGVSCPAAWAGGHAFSWRAPQEPRTHEVRTEHMTRETVLAIRVATAAPPARPLASVGGLVGHPQLAAAGGNEQRRAPALAESRQATVITPSPATDGQKPAVSIGQTPALPATTRLPAARALAVTPTLVWFSLRAAHHLPRAVQERRAAALVARDGVRQRFVAASPVVRATVDPSTAEAATVSLVSAFGADDRLTPPVQLGATPRPAHETLPQLVPLPQQWMPTRAPFHEPAWAPAAATRRPVHGAPPSSLPSLVAAAIAAPAGRVLAVVTDVLEGGVESRVREEVARAMAPVQAERSAAAATPTAPPPGGSSVAGRVDDRLAGAMLDRIRGLLREERFRHGLLR